MVEMHNDPTARHPGRDETIHKMCQKYYWPKMKEWITDYIKGCATCQQVKINMHLKKTPPYQIPTKIRTLPFQTIAIDLIMGLPPSKGHDAILTIVDHGCSRVAVFLLCTSEITGPDIVWIYLEHIFSWYGLPNKVISDRDPQFTSHFGRALAKSIGTQQNLSTVFHPQMDGLTEWKNQ